MDIKLKLRLIKSDLTQALIEVNSIIDVIGEETFGAETREKVRWIDPPSGWKYGFPKVYNIKDNQSHYDWLEENGYPVKGNEKILELGTRMWKEWK